MTATTDSQEFFTLYRSPPNYLGEFVLLNWVSTRVSAAKGVQPGIIIARSSSREDAQRGIPEGAICMGKSLGEDPNIIATWMGG